MVARKKLKGADKICVRVGRVFNEYKVAKHFELIIEQTSFSSRIDQQKVEQEAALDGVYVLRTPLRAEIIEAVDIVRSYKSLSDVERAFRSLKSVDLKVRPIHHHLPDRVRARCVAKRM
jgi:transposase